MEIQKEPNMKTGLQPCCILSKLQKQCQECAQSLSMLSNFLQFLPKTQENFFPVMKEMFGRGNFAHLSAQQQAVSQAFLVRHCFIHLFTLLSLSFHLALFILYTTVYIRCLGLPLVLVYNELLLLHYYCRSHKLTFITV